MLATAFGYGIPAWFDEELNPLLGLLARNQPITHIDARQYGVVVFLTFDPLVRAVRGEPVGARDVRHVCVRRCVCRSPLR